MLGDEAFLAAARGVVPASRLQPINRSRLVTQARAVKRKRKLQRPPVQIFWRGHSFDKSKLLCVAGASE
jgi:hypothetical protein